MDLRSKKVHMVGIGGIGMSGLGRVLAEMGCEVRGSDTEKNDVIKKLEQKGIIVNMGHSASHLKDPDILVYSSSIRGDNPELLAAKKKKIPAIPRMELLKTLFGQNKKGIAVMGTHGKTTITAMASLVLEKAGLDPTILIGGQSPHFDGNAKLGKKKTIVAEVDESDGRFASLKATHILIANLEREHAEFYADEAHLVEVFKQFVRAQSRKTRLFYSLEDANLRGLSGSFKGKKASFGFLKGADVRAANVKISPYRIDFDCFRQKQKAGRFTLNIPGIHNVLNSLAVISLGFELGLNVKVMKDALASYRGVKRRFEIIGEARGAKIVEDYAHHPTEIRATIQAAHSTGPQRLITVFQPHRYTRTKSFYKEFSNSFGGADEVILTEVYSASEDRIEGASAKDIYDIMVKDNSVPVKFLEKDRIPEYLSKEIKKGDLVLVMGAGNIGKTAHEIVAKLKR